VNDGPKRNVIGGTLPASLVIVKLAL
jgi:hypothetical protein